MFGFPTDQALSYLRSSSPSLLSSLFPNTNTNTATASFARSNHDRPHPPPAAPWLDYLTVHILTPLSSLFLSDTNPTPSSSSPGNTTTTTTTGILATLLLLTSLFVLFKIANYIRRLVMCWVLFLFRIAVIYVVMLVGWSVWARGLDTTLRDVAGMYGFVEGLLAGVGDGARDYDAGRLGRRVHGSGNGYGFGYGGRGGGQIPVGTRRGAGGGWG